MKPQAYRRPDFAARRQLRAARERGERVHFPPFRYPPQEKHDPGLVNSLPFLVPFAAVCIAILILRAWGYL